MYFLHQISLNLTLKAPVQDQILFLRVERIADTIFFIVNSEKIC